MTSQNIVNLLGAGSGIDTSALVSELVAVEKEAPQERIDTKREKLETQISDLGLLSSALSTLQDAAAAMGDADTFNSKSASFTDSTAFIPVSLEAEAQAGDYSFTVSQLASAQSFSADAVFDSASDAVGTGTLTFSFGSWDAVTPPADPTTFTENTEKESFSITIDNTNNSLQGLANAINDADQGVQASIINDGSGYRLIVRAESGATNQLQITATDTDGNDTDASGLSNFAFNASAFNMTQNQVGQDAQFTVNGLAVTRSTNSIDDVIDGFEFSLAGVTGTGETVNVTIEEDTSGAEEAVRGFVEAYNLFLETIEPLIGDNEETGEKGSLYTDSISKNIPSRIRQLLVGDVPGLDETFTALANVGILTELDGTMSIDEDTFTDAIDDNYDLFKSLFIPSTESSSEQITINSYGDNTISGEYAVEITQAPTQGNLVGVDSSDTLLTDLSGATAATSAEYTFSMTGVDLSILEPVSGDFTAGTATIALNLATLGAGATDYDFSVTVDGVASAASISLPIADYASYDDMATALETAINADANISDVTVAYDTDHFVFTSATTGVASSVSLSAVGVNSDQLGISTGTTNTGTGGVNDFDFTINIDGLTSGTISLTPGTYSTYDEFAAELQTQINADATLTAAGIGITAAYDGSDIVFTSNSSGASSTFGAITPIGSELTNLGVGTASVTQGVAQSYDVGFQISVNGTTSGTITIEPQTLATKDDLATVLQNQINADSALSAAGAAVTVTYDSDTDGFIIESTKYGSTSTVSVTNIGANAADLGLSAGTSTTGINVAGTINGVAGFGSGNVLLPALGEDGESLTIVVGETATSATLNFSRGFGAELELLLEQFLATNGTLDLKEESLDGDLEDLDDDQDRLDRRIEAYEERLTAQFIAMEAIVRSLQDSSSFLESTLNSLLNNGDE